MPARLKRFLDPESRDYAPKWKFKLETPDWAFKPDRWTLAFLRGLTRHAETNSDWKDRSVWEVGVGTGVNLVVLGSLCPYARFFFSDYDNRCVPLALENARRNFTTLPEMTALPGSWDLVTPPAGSELKAPRVRTIYGCLPQVPLHADLSVGDKRAHYYDPALYREAHLNSLGLGLNEALLARAKALLQPGDEVILNLGGRPGLPKLRSLFIEAGFEPQVIWQETIPQHAGTSLESLVKLEAGEHHTEFEFFSDPECTQPISASAAEERRLLGQSVFHKIYVIVGKLA